MKLNELLGVKKYQNHRLSDLSSALHNSNIWNKLGSGSFAQVLERNGKVYKFWVTDFAYEAFVKYAISHPNKHVPRIGQIKTLAIGSKKIKYVELEKLTPVTNGFDHIIQLSDSCQMELETFLEILSYNSSKSLEYTIKHFKNEYEKLIENDQPIELIKLVLDLDDVINGTEFSFDLHPGNIMMRGSDYVIVDPFWNHNTKIGDRE